MIGLANSFDLDRICVVLVATRNPLNIGAAARAMSNFGFGQLRVVNPYEPSFREAKSAVGAAELLKSAEEFGSVAEAVADCTLVVGPTAGRDRDLQHGMRPLEEAGRLIRGEASWGRAAILFGSEKRGLSNEDFSHCHWLMRIPTREGQPSMNLGQAVAVTLYELIRSPEAAPSSGKRAAAAEIERLREVMVEALRECGYEKPNAGKSMAEKVRRMVHRMAINPEDAETLTGMIRKMVWKMKSRQGAG
jgi:TrmH family RNA methyltransferase